MREEPELAPSLKVLAFLLTVPPNGCRKLLVCLFACLLSFTVSRSVAGFCNYRFVVEEELVVLYVYELQISEKHRRRGLGRGLLQLAEDLALNTSMDGVCLTALKGNAPAMKFYQGLGYVAASFDPSVMFPHDADKYDYVIFNKLEAIYFKQGCPTKALTL